MKMQMWIYQTKKSPEQGFCIQDHKNNKFTVWCDSFEGGYAYDSDWEYCGEYSNYPMGDFKSYEEAYKWVVDNYGEVVDIDEVED